MYAYRCFSNFTRRYQRTYERAGAFGQTINNNLRPESWFNNTRQDIFPQEVRVNIDNNIAKLGGNDAKFYLINISPSQKEIAHLQELFGKQGAEQKLKEFAASVMDAYARNFKRAGIGSGQDLLWYGKLERNRYYSAGDKEVKEGLKSVETVKRVGRCTCR